MLATQQALSIPESTHRGAFGAANRTSRRLTATSKHISLLDFHGQQSICGNSVDDGSRMCQTSRSERGNGSAEPTWTLRKHGAQLGHRVSDFMNHDQHAPSCGWLLQADKSPSTQHKSRSWRSYDAKLTIIVTPAMESTLAMSLAVARGVDELQSASAASEEIRSSAGTTCRFNVTRSAYRSISTIYLDVSTLS